MGCTIIGCGKALPSLEITNHQFSDLVETSDEWIVRRTGIQSRRIAEHETTLDLAEAAARQALGWTGGEAEPTTSGWRAKHLAPEDIDLVAFSTVTPDAIVPSCAALLARRLGLTRAVAFDINAACTGFVYGLAMVESMLAASAPLAKDSARRNPYKRALVIGAERISRITNWEDRSTCVLLGDGAGAAVVEWDESKPGIMATFLENSLDTDNALTCAMSFDSKQPFNSSGVSAEVMAAPDPSLRTIDAELGLRGLDEGLSMFDASSEDAEQNAFDEQQGIGVSGERGIPGEQSVSGERGIPDVSDGQSIPDEQDWRTNKTHAARQLLSMNGQKVFKFATRAMGKAVEEVCKRAGISINQVRYIVPHQANERIIKFAAKRYHMPLEKFQISIAHRGNASSACIPMALSDLYEDGRIQPGDKVILVGFGGGFTSGAVLLEV